jgi:antitoxin CptB
MKKSTADPLLSKLRWACRRGMLELDVLLGNFLEKTYTLWTNEEQQQFVELLNYTDPELFAWIMGHEVPPASMVKITEKIRHAQSGISI